MLPKINTIIYACDLEGKTQAAMEPRIKLSQYSWRKSHINARGRTT
ncbi:MULTISPECIES: hypothetical protein [Marinomonas]|uniref:Uncharacterized protein n=1 Tax=Marinomonas rhodophyticola TaxID=2992803 RepID=A0ABT3KHK2_9GAMM|nr:hypothetical protein [Marinomonas sp. KJ51-3]MCW4629552.1 hypothetical protein [Marinomonas sp. KJ51-3]